MQFSAVEPSFSTKADATAKPTWDHAACGATPFSMPFPSMGDKEERTKNRLALLQDEQVVQKIDRPEAAAEHAHSKAQGNLWGSGKS